jgi:hypothetical protein
MTDGVKDRGTALVIFGALQILLGVAALCMLLGFAAGVEMQTRSGALPPQPLGPIVSNIAFYAIGAAYFFAAGVGSIRKRRWACALSLVVSAMWLAGGAISIVAVAIVAPYIMSILPPSETTLILTILFITLGVAFILLPLVLFLFYRSESVRATCAAADPNVRWTDRVPPPILALVLLMAYGAVSTLISISYGVVPLFGTIFTGAPAVIVLLAFSGLFAFLAVQLYRMKRSAWWTLVLLHVIGGGIGAWTLMGTDFQKLYEQMGLMTQQLRAMRLVELYRDPMLWIFIAVCWVAMLAFLLWTRRFFDAPPPRTRESDARLAA